MGPTRSAWRPTATWFACQGFDQNTGYGYNAELLECAEFILAPWDLTGANPDPDLRADVVNNSWGGGQAQWWYNQAIYAWRAAGIFPAFSAGNEGPGLRHRGRSGRHGQHHGRRAPPTATTHIASFSSRGPATITGLTKPNVSAPGVNIHLRLPRRHLWPDGRHLDGRAPRRRRGGPPLVGRARPARRRAAHLLDHRAERPGHPGPASCGGDGPATSPNNVYGWGRIDAYEAVSLALSSDWDIPWLDVNPAQRRGRALVAP